MTRTLQNERGIALLIVLMIVALLTVIVTEFTYSVQLDQHRARHALHALQAQLLARSGTNIVESFLVQDQEPRFDAYTEDWWLQLQQFCTGLEIDPTMHIICDVEDESGKININRSRTKPQAQQQAVGQRKTGDAFVRDALRRIFDAHQIPVKDDQNIGDALFEYWLSEPPPGWEKVPPFTSVEDFAAKFEVPTQFLPRLRHLLTTRSRAGINANTAPPEVLTAVINNGAAVEAIDQRRKEDAFANTSELRQILTENDVDDASIIGGLFGVTSRLYRLQASAVANSDPASGVNGGSGVGQTVSLLVDRQSTRRQQGTEGPLWTVRPLDWQREGGARLLHKRSQEEKEEGDEGNEDGLDPLTDVP